MKKLLLYIAIFLSFVVPVWSATNWAQTVMVDSVTKQFMDPTIIPSNQIVVIGSTNAITNTLQQVLTAGNNMAGLNMTNGLIQGMSTVDLTNNATKGNTAYGWGNHATNGYATTGQVAQASNNVLAIASTNALALATSAGTNAVQVAGTNAQALITSATGTLWIATTNADAGVLTSAGTNAQALSANGNTAYGWGNHATNGYATTGQVAQASNDVVTIASTNAQALATAAGTNAQYTASTNTASIVSAATGTLWIATTNADAGVLTSAGTNVSAVVGSATGTLWIAVTNADAGILTSASTNAQAVATIANTNAIQVASTNAAALDNAVLITVSTGYVAKVGSQYYSPQYAGTTNVDWNNGNCQSILLANETAGISFTNGAGGGRYLLYMKQPAVGSGLVTWPDSMLWSGGTEPTLMTTTSAVDLLSFYCDGTNYYGAAVSMADTINTAKTNAIQIASTNAQALVTSATGTLWIATTNADAGILTSAGTNVSAVVTSATGTLWIAVTNADAGILTSASTNAQALVSAGFVWNTSPSVDHTATSGVSIVGTAGEDLVFGQVCYLKSDGKYWKAMANTNATMPGVALALGSISSNATGSLLIQGYARDDSWGFTAGNLLWVSAVTSGVVTSYQPTNSLGQLQILGYATAATNMYFNPQYLMVELK